MARAGPADRRAEHPPALRLERQIRVGPSLPGARHERTDLRTVPNTARDLDERDYPGYLATGNLTGTTD
jgi:hypothetical protein